MSLSLSLDSLHHLHCFPSNSTATAFPKPLLLRPPKLLRRPPSAFLDPSALRNLHLLESFSYSSPLPSGHLHVRLMRPAELDLTVRLLASSFADALLFPSAYVAFLAFLIRLYLLEKRNVLPHAATLVGYYTAHGEDETRFAATAEISFDELGANISPPTPVPPRDCGYICNMTVEKDLRRRGIGRHLLKACETLISQICQSRRVYLHCRLIDTGPFNMYKNAGYVVLQTDNFLVWLRFQRRKHLMSKKLPPKDEGLNSGDNLVLETTSTDLSHG